MFALKNSLASHCLDTGIDRGVLLDMSSLPQLKLMNAGRMGILAVLERIQASLVETCDSVVDFEILLGLRNSGGVVLFQLLPT